MMLHGWVWRDGVRALVMCDNCAICQVCDMHKDSLTQFCPFWEPDTHKVKRVDTETEAQK